jgi:hypothetical protein
MARVGRWVGAIVVETTGGQWLVGNPKEPCAEVPETLAAPWMRALGTTVPLSAPLGIDDGDGEAIARALAQKLVIQRNGSVSERLWRLCSADGATRLQWLIDAPAPVWEIVRDTVLRCS